MQLAAKEFFEFRYLDRITVKGKDTPVKIYELIWEKWCIKDIQSQIYDNFTLALELYTDRKFTDAYDIFSELSQQWDAPSEAYMQRCKTYIENPPNNDWDGVFKMTEK